MGLVFLPSDSSYGKSKSKAVDWLGIALLTITVGSIQTFLEEGEKEGWFESGLMTTLAIASVLGLILFIWRELSISNPAVDLRVLRNRSLAAGSVYSAVLGMGLYGALFAVPIFAQSVLHFTATQTGILLFPGALASAITMVMLGKISRKFDPRVLIAGGGIITSLVMFSLGNINPDTGTETLFWPLVWRGVGTVMMFLPLSLASLGSLPKQDIAAGSGFYNLTRQLGGSIGIAVLTTLLAQREAFHRAILVEKLSIFNPIASQRIDALAGAFQGRGMDAATAQKQALMVMNQSINLQSAILSFEDIFKVVGIAFICSLPLLLFLGKPPKGANAPAAH